MSSRTLPRLWPFLLALALLLPLWIIALETFMKPDELSNIPVAPLRRLAWWLVPPLVAALGAFAIVGGRKLYRGWREARLIEAEAQAREARERAEAAAAQAARDQARYSLEVYGLGLSVCWSSRHWFTQDTLWEALRKGEPLAPTDPKAYPWSRDEKGSSGALNASEAALKDFPEKWELPFLLAGPVQHDPEYPDYLKAGLAGARTGGGMHYHRFRTVAQVYEDEPDRLPEELFGLFDQYPDLPAAALAVEDSLHMRDMFQPPDAPSMIENGYEVPSLTGSAAVILVGRRDRVDLLRPTATDIPIREIWIPFETEPPPKGIELTSDYVLSYDDAPPEPELPDRWNQPKPFWEAQGGAPAAFKASRFVKRPWCQEQLVQFDLLRIRARIHRPQTAEYGEKGPRERERIFLEAWEKALATLPEGQKPVRVIYDFGPKGAARLSPLVLALHKAGPDLEIPGKDGLDLTERLRDTGADSLYVAMALGILATEKEGGVSAVVHLRRPDRATILMVSPPTPQDRQRRKIQFHSEYLGTVNQE